MSLRDVLKNVPSTPPWMQEELAQDRNESREKWMVRVCWELKRCPNHWGQFANTYPSAPPPDCEYCQSIQPAPEESGHAPFWKMWTAWKAARVLRGEE